MQSNYLGRELYNKIDNLVNKVYHEVYTYNEKNWYHVERIELDYSVTEDDADVPLVDVLVRCGSVFDGTFEVTFHYSLEKGDEYNIGYMVRELHEVLDD